MPESTREHRYDVAGPSQQVRKAIHKDRKQKWMDHSITVGVRVGATGEIPAHDRTSVGQLVIQTKCI